MKGVTKDVAFDVTYGGTIDTGRGVKNWFQIEWCHQPPRIMA